MSIAEFIHQFAETHQVQNVEDICGTIVAPITKDAYLVNVQEVKNR